MDLLSPAQQLASRASVVTRVVLRFWLRKPADLGHKMESLRCNVPDALMDTSAEGGAECSRKYLLNVRRAAYAEAGVSTMLSS